MLEVYSEVNELRSRFGRWKSVPGWTLLHFWGVIFYCKTRKYMPDMYSEVNGLRGRFGR